MQKYNNGQNSITVISIFSVGIPSANDNQIATLDARAPSAMSFALPSLPLME